MAVYSEGSLIRLTGTFLTDAGAAIDPSIVSITIQIPDGTSQTYVYAVDPEITRTGVGIYHIEVDTTGEPGLWLYRWFSTGTGQSAAGNNYFRVTQARPV